MASVSNQIMVLITCTTEIDGDTDEAVSQCAQDTETMLDWLKHEFEVGNSDELKTSTKFTLEATVL